MKLKENELSEFPEQVKLAAETGVNGEEGVGVDKEFKMGDKINITLTGTVTEVGEGGTSFAIGEDGAIDIVKEEPAPEEEVGAEEEESEELGQEMTDQAGGAAGESKVKEYTAESAIAEHKLMLEDKAFVESHLDEKSPEGWEGTVKAMKGQKGITNPWALSHWMKNKGYKSHMKETMEEAPKVAEGKLPADASENPEGYIDTLLESMGGVVRNTNPAKDEPYIIDGQDIQKFF